MPQAVSTPFISLSELCLKFLQLSRLQVMVCRCYFAVHVPRGGIDAPLREPL